MFNNEVRDTYVAVAQAIFFMLGFVTCAGLVVIAKFTGGAVRFDPLTALAWVFVTALFIEQLVRRVGWP